jgi:VCBS repeat-containing protein
MLLVGQPIASYSGRVDLTTTFQPVTADFQDVGLDPGKTYLVYHLNQSSSVQAFSLGYTDGFNTYSSGQFYWHGPNSLTTTVWNTYGTLATADLVFSFLFGTPETSTVAGLNVPTGNVNEGSGISINTSGNYSGNGIFGIENPDQTGNTSLKYGKYGSLTVDALTGAFNYTPNFNKIKPLKTGETGVDEFTITLTGANNAVTSSTYRVEIIGDTGSDNGGGGNVKPENKSITIAGSRGTVSGKSGILIDGDTTDLVAGSTVKPHIKFPGQTEYSLGSARPTVDANGDFSWQRKTGKKAYVYFTDDSGDVISNRVVIPAGEARLSSSSLQAFDSDPIVGGSSNQYTAHKKGKRRRPVAPAASFGSRLSEDTNSSLLMATDTTDSGFYKQHDLVAASGGNW